MHVYLHILHVHIKFRENECFLWVLQKDKKKSVAKEACFGAPPLLLISKRAI
jgi:hypothetical protein